jgi:hypothetical protein
VRVAGALKGAAGKEIVVRHLGGVVHGIGQKVFGEAGLASGEEVVLFLRRIQGGYRTVGMAQGKFRVEVEPKSGERHAVQELQGLALARKAGDGMAVTNAGPVRFRLGDFFSKVADLISRSREGR